MAKLNYTTPVQQARLLGLTQIAELIEEYQRDRIGVILRLRKDLRISGEIEDYAADYFSLIVFFCDDFLQLAESPPEEMGLFEPRKWRKLFEKMLGIK